MQQNTQGRRFAESQPQPPVYRFPQNQPPSSRGRQGTSPAYEDDTVYMSVKDKRASKRAHPGKRRKIFSLWNLFAVIGMITTVIQVIRYVLIPLLVYLNAWTGGAL